MKEIFILNEIWALDKIWLVEIFYLSHSTGTGSEL
jgi:hypothetical protein